MSNVTISRGSEVGQARVEKRSPLRRLWAGVRRLLWYGVSTVGDALLSILIRG